MPNYYEILGVDPTADVEAIKAAFRKKSLVYHPDKNTSKSEQESKSAAEMMKKLNEAHECLIDPEKRKEHDEKLKKVPSEQKKHASVPKKQSPQMPNASVSEKQSPQMHELRLKLLELREERNQDPNKWSSHDLHQAISQAQGIYIMRPEMSCDDVASVLKSFPDLVNHQDVNPDDPDFDGATLLMQCASISNVPDVLLKAGANVNQRSKSNRTALMYSAGSGYYSLFLRLIEANASLDSQDNYGLTALMYLSIYTSFANVELLSGPGSHEISSVMNHIFSKIASCCNINLMDYGIIMLDEKESPSKKNGGSYLYNINLTKYGVAKTDEEKIPKTAIDYAVYNNSFFLVDELLRLGATVYNTKKLLSYLVSVLNTKKENYFYAGVSYPFKACKCYNHILQVYENELLRNPGFQHDEKLERELKEFKIDAVVAGFHSLQEELEKIRLKKAKVVSIVDSIEKQVFDSVMSKIEFTPPLVSLVCNYYRDFDALRLLFQPPKNNNKQSASAASTLKFRI